MGLDEMSAPAALRTREEIPLTSGKGPIHHQFELNGQARSLAGALTSRDLRRPQCDRRSSAQREKMLNRSNVLQHAPLAERAGGASFEMKRPLLDFWDWTAIGYIAMDVVLGGLLVDLLR